MKRKFTIISKKIGYQINDSRNNEWHFITATEALRTTASILNDAIIQQLIHLDSRDSEIQVELTITPKEH